MILGVIVAVTLVVVWLWPSKPEEDETPVKTK